MEFCNSASVGHEQIEAVDLFCGAGGLTCGLRAAGVAVKVGVDADPACAYPYEVNNQARFLCEDVAKVSGSQVNSFFSGHSVRLLAGCAPCQTFSSYNRKASEADNRWWLLLQFSRLIRETRPELVTMENVPGLERQNVFRTFVSDLQAMGYRVQHQVVACEKYGVPQARRRLVLLASLLGNIRLLSPEEFGAKLVTVREAIGTLPAIKAGGKATQGDILHQSADLSPLNLRRIRASHPGGSWRDWPNDLVCRCHKKEAGSTYSSVYGRMTWDQPSPTITTQFYSYGSGRFGHPEQDRALSLREGAILQGFPKSYRFVRNKDEVNKKIIGRLIGNAVPVGLGKVIGRSLIVHLSEVKFK